MVVINITQQKMLNALWTAKQQHDLDDKKFQEWVATERSNRKAGLREMVAEAMAAGIPTRQIHQAGLGMKQVASMHNFLGESGITNEALLGLVMPKPTQYGTAPVAMPTVETSMELKGGKAYWTRSDGTKRVEPFFSQEYGVIYLMAEVTDEDKDIIDSLNSNRVLFGDSEIEAFEEGTKPARWDGKNIPVPAPTILKYPKN